MQLVMTVALAVSAIGISVVATSATAHVSPCFHHLDNNCYSYRLSAIGCCLLLPLWVLLLFSRLSRVLNSLSDTAAACYLKATTDGQNTVATLPTSFLPVIL